MITKKGGSDLGEINRSTGPADIAGTGAGFGNPLIAGASPRPHFERLERPVEGYVYAIIADVAAFSHGERGCRVVVLRSGEKLMIADTPANMVTLLGYLPEEMKSDA